MLSTCWWCADLPVDGHWRVRFAFYVPAFSHGALPESVFPSEALEPVSNQDFIDVEINGVTQTLTAEHSLEGHKEEVEIIMDGQRAMYTFSFHSSKGVRQLHPFITSGEITLIRDRLPPPAPSGPMGSLEARVADAVDGKDIAKSKRVSNGYVKKAWTLDSEAVMLVFQGSTLVQELTANKGSFKEQLPAGTYSCLTLHSKFYANFESNCVVLPKPQKTFLGQISLSPWLNPGNT